MKITIFQRASRSFSLLFQIHYSVNNLEVHDFLNHYNFFKNTFFEKRLRNSFKNIVFFNFNNQVLNSKNT